MSSHNDTSPSNDDLGADTHACTILATWKEGDDDGSNYFDWSDISKGWFKSVSIIM